MKSKLCSEQEYSCHCEDEYITHCFEEFDKFSAIGTKYSELYAALAPRCSAGSFGLYDPEILESEKERVNIVDYACLRDASAYVVFSEKDTDKITRKLPISEFWGIYDSLLKSGYSEIDNTHGSWYSTRNRCKKNHKFGF
jgi:hypothetical protein